MNNGWWLPVAISRHATAYDTQFLRTLIAAVVIFVVVQIALIAIVLRYRSAGVPVRAGREGTRLEAIWTVATAVLFLGLLALGG